MRPSSSVLRSACKARSMRYRVSRLASDDASDDVDGLYATRDGQEPGSLRRISRVSLTDLGDLRKMENMVVVGAGFLESERWAINHIQRRYAYD